MAEKSSTSSETIAMRFQGAMMMNDWLCESNVGHEVGTCLECISTALAASGVPALLDVAEAAQAIRDKKDAWVLADDGTYFDCPAENRALADALDTLRKLPQ